MRQLKHLFTAALMLFVVTACDEGTGVTEPEPEPLNGEISGVVTAEGQAVIGAQVGIAGQGIQQIGATDGVGGFRFTGLDAGTYTISVGNVEGVTFGTTSQSATLSEGSSSASVAFNGEYIRTSSITGEVILDGQGAAGIGVTLSGEGSRATTTDANGGYSFSGLKAGTYTVAINAPTGSDFPVTTQTVEVGTGDTEVVTFEGTMPLTATVAIKSITTGNTNVPVNPAAVVGQIDVTVTVNDPDNQIRKLEVLVDDEVCAGCSQSFSVAGEDVDPEFAPTGEYVYTILTNGLDENGGVLYKNGTRQITVEATINDEVGASASSVDLVFANVDTWVVLSASAPAGPVVGENDTNNWWGMGDFTVMAVHANYSDNNVTGANATLSNSTDGAATGSQDAETGVWTFVFDEPESTNLVAGSTLNLAGVLDVGGSVNTNGGTFFLDQTGPAGGVYNLTSQSANNLCCSNNWFSPVYDQNDGHTGGVDAGVGRETVTFWAFDPAGFAVPTAPTNAEIIAATATGYSGDTGGTMVKTDTEEVGLPPTDQNTDWVMVAAEADGLGNLTFVTLSAAGDHPLTATAGHDAGNPTTGLCTGAGTPNATCTVASHVQGDAFNLMTGVPGGGDLFQAFAFDVGGADVGGPSGVTPGSELFGTLQLEVPTATTCVLGVVVNGVCNPVSMAAAPGGVQVDNATGTQGYWTWSALGRDRVGNSGGGFGDQTILNDQANPVVTAIFQPQGVLMGGGNYNFISTWTDNLDGSAIRSTLEYGFGAQLQVGTTDIPDGGFGPPFATAGNINANVPFFIRRIDRSNPNITSAGAPAVGINLDNLAPQFMQVYLEDVAGNTGTNTSPALVYDNAGAAAGGIVATSNGNVLTYGFRNAGGLLDISDGDTEVLEVVLTGTLGQVTNPCSRGVALHMLDPDFMLNPVQVFMTNMTSLPPEEDAVERRWRFTYTYAPTTGAPANPIFMAMCSDANGDALISIHTAVTTQP